ncbi:uncharacterized protein [Palaemon carinicauda]|uniref:uncharacterized protein n=1 Tax=Palaemon carinicauda TaxID=392227 RepID=UPI0035B59E93
MCTGGYCDLLRGIDVPLYAFAGGTATLSCTYDLRATRLYSLKWYHNYTEFYRYVPTERNRPINIQPSHKFSVIEEFRNDARVTITLAQLRVSASGQYRCEVIAEHPSFRTEAKSANMTVLREPLAPPVLVGAREIYEPTELIKIGCQPRRPYHPDHRPTLQWYLEGNQDIETLRRTFQECSSLRFTVKHSNDKQLPFQDVLKSPDSSGFNTCVCNKPTNLGLCLNGEVILPRLDQMIEL